MNLLVQQLLGEQYTAHSLRGLAALGRQHKLAIPGIQALVVNKRTGVPGEGIGNFVTPLPFRE